MKSITKVIMVAMLLVSVITVLGCTSTANLPAPTPVPTAIHSQPTYVAPTATPKPVAAVGFSRANPAPIGDTIYVKSTDYKGEFQYNLKLEQVVAGDSAWSMIKSANMFNDAPAAGKQYMLAKFIIAVTGTPDVDTSYYVNPFNFEAISSTGTAYDSVLAVAPDPKLSSSLYSGGSTEGWVVFEVNQGDNPLIVYDRNTYSGTGGVWFKTS